MALDLPIIAWGAADDISGAGWASVNTPIVTGGQTGPFGGADAYLINDDDVVIGEARYKQFIPREGVVTIPLMVRQGSATQGGWACGDETSGFANTAFIDITGWVGPVPTIVVGVTLGAMSASVSAPVSLGGGWYLVLATFTGIVAGNTHRYYCYPSVNSAGGAALTGSTYFYVRNVLLLDYLDDAKGWDEPPPGAKQVRAPSGLTDRWIPNSRRDYRLRGRARWIQSAPRSFPEVISGWAGLNESIGVDCGVRSMLKAGQEGQDLLWVPDRRDCATYLTSELVKPWDGESYEVDNAAGDRALTLELRNLNTSYPVVV